MKLTGDMVRVHQVKKSARMLNNLIFLFYNIFGVFASNTIREFNLNVLGLVAVNNDSVSYQIISSWGNTTKLICVSACLQNLECDAAVVCKTSKILQCSHVKGNVFNQVYFGNSASGGCQVITRGRCSNGGVFYNDICHCPVGFTGPECNLDVPVCCQNVSRQKEYSGMTDGDISSGSISNIIDAIKMRETHKILVKGQDYNTIYSVMSKGFYYNNVGPRVWAQTYDHASVDFTDLSNKTILRVIKQISNRKIVTVFSELNSAAETRIETSTDIEWATGTFAENLPILEIDDDGNVTSGSVSDCRGRLENGSDLRIAFPEFSLKSELIYFENSQINVHLLPTALRTYLTLNVPSVWFDIITDSGGNSNILRWKRISHRRFGSGSRNVYIATSWFMESGWHVAFSHDSTGSQISGSKLYLEASVRNGKPIKVKMNDMISRLHDVRVSSGEVTGVMVDIFNRTLWAVGHAQIIRSRVSTAGTVNSCTFTWESDMDLGWSSRQESIIWYVGSRPWTKIVSLNPFDGIIWGDFNDLYLAAMSWKSLRVVIKHLDSSYQSVDINNVHLMNSTLIILDTTVQGAVQTDELMCQQWAGFLYTDGMYETVKWTTGRTILEERTVIQYTSIDIFSEI